MGNKKNPHQDDQDDDGIPDNEQTQSQAHAGQDLDGDGVPEGEASVSSNPIIINRRIPPTRTISTRRGSLCLVARHTAQRQPRNLRRHAQPHRDDAGADAG